MTALAWFLAGVIWGNIGSAFAGVGGFKKPIYGFAMLFWPITFIYLCFAPDKTTEVPK